jgi:hypothetical protein
VIPHEPFLLKAAINGVMAANIREEPDELQLLTRDLPTPKE